ncbi:UNVERIFIED_CONTAM: hypothetical protein ABID98_000027 [Brevibacillus sp. OAP136]
MFRKADNWSVFSNERPGHSGKNKRLLATKNVTSNLIFFCILILFFFSFLYHSPIMLMECPRSSQGIFGKKRSGAFTMPARRSAKMETSFAPHIIPELHPPRSVWLWGAVSIFARSRSVQPPAGIVRAPRSFFPKIPDPPPTRSISSASKPPNSKQS